MIVVLTLFGSSFVTLVQFFDPLYHDEDEVITPPTFLEGPIFKPTKACLQAVGVYTTRMNEQCLNALSEGSAELNINLDLTHAQQQALKELLNKHSKVFASSLKDVAALKAEPHRIQVKEEIKPVKLTPRMVPHEANQWFKGYIAQLIDLGLIKSCTGPWAAAVVLVPADIDKRVPKRKRKTKAVRKAPKLVQGSNSKPRAIWNLTIKNVDNEESSSMEELQQAERGGAMATKEGIDIQGQVRDFTSEIPQVLAGKKDPYRLCLNYKPINAVTVDKGYPIPNISFLFTLLDKAKYFSVFDCLKDFWQLRLDEDSRDYTGFATTFGQFRWTRLPKGLKGSPSTWQAAMESIFYYALFKFFLIYIDDGLVFSSTFEEHLEHLDVILTKAAKANLSLSITKCRFGYQETKLLNHIVGQRGLKCFKYSKIG
ncbi:hypothetical protein G6F57_014728 [Rhizopus arrhizus]|nr:hypothetical protein G6F30_012932 [Rhizopus arrhizus]KAG1394806.1 hypothetical protein G6F58_012064 [Rhizopus delemar]KAG0973313.1 hypothetical protein G6F29_012916 [Rhizopus arrhizus]KAG0975525.1 hypothetical protein G6F28_012898 [Rhizopus arrhizus]KAG1001373.1 hypothetical protein G6F27_012935 [Rhizopus arrhizus]